MKFGYVKGKGCKFFQGSSLKNVRIILKKLFLQCLRYLYAYKSARTLKLFVKKLTTYTYDISKFHQETSNTNEVIAHYFSKLFLAHPVLI